MILKLKHHFDASHKLYNKNWSAKKNKQIYGACNNLHGHRWGVEIKIDGDTNVNGWIVNFKDLKKIINKFDHQYVNDVINVIPTAENIALILLDEIRNLGKFNMVEVTVYETPDCSITVNSLRGD